MEDIIFLTLAEVIEVHQDQINRYGGAPGVRDFALLGSSLAMPEASFGGAYLHIGLYEMAAAYAFHLSQNHPFIDGNKRTALACALLFLEFNGVTVSDPEGKLYEAMMRIAEGKMDKHTLALVFHQLANRPPIQT
ncbi:type II toxin-antitoxin system death-on-curing family toxin [Gelria sp. Kuro-4]|jgi:death-on-curing protein|uniref:type II toxin-antitoxin system death-on-curing family toxin n=1 Tax=Gelria sp. Kuro-4 TaxID=2796927 RepID=UPI001BF12F67|nr:type II toxin-antitoxin system death-on-curing family toxin [Gelria sp. Kuro-4]MDI3522210.1 death on curing protein [Bacillota bacterium]BCV23823.1 death-on-curing protein [Gelria sp. Kuro-4]